MRVVFAADYFDKTVPDELYRPEAAAFESAGVPVSTVSVDDPSAAKLVPKPEPEETVLYRGWMLNEASYKQLVSVVEASNAKPLTPLGGYLLTHHIPNWYPLVTEYTPETIVLPEGSDYEEELRKLDWPNFFVKDYVKSLKTSMGSVITDAGDIGRLVEEMAKYRGEIEGGLCVRRFEEFREGSEIRYFVVDGQPIGPDAEPIPRVVEECATRVGSRFFSIDVATRADGVKRIVELGDGQVSDLVGWQVDRFVEAVSGVM